MSFEKSQKENKESKILREKHGRKDVIVLIRHNYRGEKEEITVDKETGELLRIKTFTPRGVIETNPDIIDKASRELKVNPADLNALLDAYLTSPVLKSYFDEKREELGNGTGAIAAPSIPIQIDRSKN